MFHTNVKFVNWLDASKNKAKAVCFHKLIMQLKITSGISRFYFDLPWPMEKQTPTKITTKVIVKAKTFAIYEGISSGLEKYWKQTKS